VIFAGPGKSDAELRIAAGMGLRALVVESLRELRRYSDIAQAMDVKVRVALRVNAGKGHGALLMGGITQFGMPEEDAASAIRAIRARAEMTRVEIVGIHVFLGTRILDSGTLCAQFQTGLLVATRLQAETGTAFQFVDIGGGFGVAYYDRDSPLDLSAVGQCLTGLAGDYRRHHPWTEVIAVESGRYLVAPCGVFLATVLDVKGTRDHRFAVLDGGTNVFGGQDLYGGARATPVHVLRARSEEEVALTICGPLCTPMDRLGADLVLPTVDVGDVIAFYHAGAYGYSAAPGMFLSHGYPGEILMLDHGLVEIRRRQPIDALFQDQVIDPLTKPHK
jgi:diaminopimelate decarboxylase